MKYDSMNRIHCGEIEDDELNGHGAVFSFGTEYDEEGLFCGNFYQGELDGPTLFHFYVTRMIQMGRVTVGSNL